MEIRYEMISGFIVGINLLREDQVVLLDLGILRVVFDWHKGN